MSVHAKMSHKDILSYSYYAFHIANSIQFIWQKGDCLLKIIVNLQITFKNYIKILKIFILKSINSFIFVYTKIYIKVPQKVSNNNLFISYTPPPQKIYKDSESGKDDEFSSPIAVVRSQLGNFEPNYHPESGPGMVLMLIVV